MRDIWTEKGRDPDRIREMCELLKEAWEKSPDQRFGQFLLNYVFQKKNVQDSVPFMKGTMEGMMPDRTNAIMFNQEDDLNFELIESLAHKGISIERSIAIKKKYYKR